jgi:ribosome modulation factor
VSGSPHQILLARRRVYPHRVVTAADEQAAEGRQAGRLGRPLSDCPAQVGGELRRAWRAGWRLGREEYVANCATWEAGLRAYGGSAPRRRRAA